MGGIRECNPVALGVLTIAGASDPQSSSIAPRGFLVKLIDSYSVKSDWQSPLQ